MWVVACVLVLYLAGRRFSDCRWIVGGLRIALGLLWDSGLGSCNLVAMGRRTARLAWPCSIYGGPLVLLLRLIALGFWNCARIVWIS